MIKNSHLSKFHRIFFGIPITAEFYESLKTLVMEQQPDILNEYKLVRPEQCHITIRFIGDFEESRIQGLIAGVEQAISGFAQFPIVIERIASFPPYQSRIIAAYVSVDQALLNVFAALERSLSLFNIPKERHPFQPHITLCRQKKRRRIFQFNPILLADKKIILQELILFRSDLNKEGSRYTVLHRFRL